MNERAVQLAAERQEWERQEREHLAAQARQDGERRTEVETAQQRVADRARDAEQAWGLERDRLRGQLANAEWAQADLAGGVDLSTRESSCRSVVSAMRRIGAEALVAQAQGRLAAHEESRRNR